MGVATRNRTRVIGTSFLLFCTSLFLTAYSAKHKAVGENGTTLFAQMFNPFQLASSGVWGHVSGIGERYFEILGVKEENIALKERLSYLETEYAKLLEFKAENARLRKLVKMADDNNLQVLGARIIGFDTSNWVEGITINRGTVDGVTTGMAVVNGVGVVGQVIAVAPTSAKVLLITDHSSEVDALVQSNRARGVVEGLGKNRCALRYVTREEDLKIGDRVLTSGMDGIYPKGLLIGKISILKNQMRSLFQTVEVTPAVNFYRLEEVMVLPSRVSETPKVAENSKAVK